MATPLQLKRALPNFFTFGNMASGFFSVIAAHQGDFVSAIWLIGLAAICDTLDGIAARLTKTSSQFGIELDSIADVVSFGFAPAFLMYTLELHSLGIIGMIGSAIFLIAGGFRLARFNSQLVGFDKSYFVGLPIPAGAVTIASYILYYYRNEQLQTVSPYLSLALTVFVALLMASHVRYDTIPKPNKEGFKKNPLLFSLIFIGLVLAIATTGRAVFILFILFITFGIFKHLKNQLTGKA